MSQNKMRLIRKFARVHKLNLKAIKRTYYSLSHLGKEKLSARMKEANG